MSIRVPHGLLLFPLLFLIGIATILRDIEYWLVEELPALRINFPLYIDDLHYTIYNARRHDGSTGEC